MKTRLLIISFLLSLPTIAQAVDPGKTWKEADSVDGRWNQTDIGPFLGSAVPTPGGLTTKGLSIKIGDKQEATVAYDLQTITARAIWTGGFLKFDPARYGIVRTPQIDGTIQFQTKKAAWGSSAVHYRGLYQHGGIHGPGGPGQQLLAPKPGDKRLRIKFRIRRRRTGPVQRNDMEWG